jgi:hypothetical protein
MTFLTRTCQRSIEKSDSFNSATTRTYLEQWWIDFVCKAEESFVYPSTLL